MTPIIYCSGPLFCPEEQGGMAALKDRSSRALVAEIAALCADSVSSPGRSARGR